MGTVKILAVLLLLTASVSAQIPGRLDSLKAYVNLEVYGDATPNANDTILQSAINRAIDIVGHSLPAHQKWDTVTTTKYTPLYSLNSDFVTAFAAVRWIDTVDGGPQGMFYLEQISPDSMFKLNPAGRSQPAIEESPRHFATFGKQIMFNPPPAKAYTIFIAYFAEGTKLDTASDSLPTNFELREPVLQEAAKIIKAMRNGQ